jgi:hypothetical protein
MRLALAAVAALLVLAAPAVAVGRTRGARGAPVRTPIRLRRAGSSR